MGYYINVEFFRMCSVFMNWPMCFPMKRRLTTLSSEVEPHQKFTGKSLVTKPKTRGKSLHKNMPLIGGKC